MVDIIVRQGEQRQIAKQKAVGEAANEAMRPMVFKTYLRKISANTKRSQLGALRKFAEYLRNVNFNAIITGELLQSDPEMWHGVTWGLVNDYLDWLLESGYTIGTINHRLNAVKTYSKLACAAETINVHEYTRISLIPDFSYADGININEDREQTRVGEFSYVQNGRVITRNGTEKDEPNILTPEQMAKLVNPDSYKWFPSNVALRDHLILCLFCENGLRCGEVAGLQLKNIDLETGIFKVWRKKVKKWESHKLYERGHKAMIAYVEKIKPDNDKLILAMSKGGIIRRKKITTRGIAFRVTWIAGRFFNIQNLSPHDLRHSLFTNARKSGNDEIALQRMGGWSNGKMLEHYAKITRIANDNVNLPF